MKGHKRWLAAVMACLLACQGTAFAAEDSGATEPWRRVEPGGDYVTIRVDAGIERDLTYMETKSLAVRYADTKEPVALTSDYNMGYLFATVPVENADRPLEAFLGEEPVWTDLKYPTDPVGTMELHIRGVIQGDAAGRLNQKATLTRAEAFALMVRLLRL